MSPWQPYFGISTCSENTALDTDTKSAVCTVPIRRLVFKNPADFDTIKGQKLKVALVSELPTPATGQTEVDWSVQANVDKFAALSQNAKKPGQWEVAFPVGTSFNLHWQYGIDWEGFTLVRSRMFRRNEAGFVLQFNYTDRRDAFHVTTGGDRHFNVTDGRSLLTTAPTSSASKGFGYHKNFVDNNLKLAFTIFLVLLVGGFVLVAWVI